MNGTKGWKNLSGNAVWEIYRWLGGFFKSVFITPLGRRTLTELHHFEFFENNISVWESLMNFGFSNRHSI